MINVVQYNSRPLVEIHERFLSQAECTRLLSLPLNFGRSMGWSNETDATHVTEHRTSSTAYAGHRTPRLKKRVADHLGLDISTLEDLQYQKYEKGQEYRPHFDFFSASEIHSENNRICTFIMYLNDDFTGGYTSFPNLNLSIKPKAGDALFFRYDYDDAMINNLTLHSGEPVQSGVKYIVTGWFRKKEIKR